MKIPKWVARRSPARLTIVAAADLFWLSGVSWTRNIFVWSCTKRRVDYDDVLACVPYGPIPSAPYIEYTLLSCRDEKPVSL